MSPPSLSFNYQQGTPPPPAQNLTVSSTNSSQLPFTVTASATWIAVLTSGTTPEPLAISVNPFGLNPNTYSGSLTISSSGVPSVTVNITLTISAPQQPQLSVNAPVLNLTGFAAGAPSTAQIQVANAGGSVLSFTASSTGGSWLSVSPASVAVSTQPFALTVTADPTQLNAGTYQGSVTVAGAGSTVVLPVTFLVASPAPLIQLSQTGLRFTAVSGGGVPLPQTLAVQNAGNGTLSWTPTASTLAGDDWLQVAPSGGAANVTIDPDIAASLAPGDYYGQIQIAGEALNSPQFATVVLSILPADAQRDPEVTPSGLVFTGADPQNVSIGVSSAAGEQFVSGRTGSGFSYSPASAAVAPNQPATIQVFPDLTGLPPGGIGQGTIALQFPDGTARTINVLTVAGPPATGSCPILTVQWRAPSLANITVVQGQAQTLELQVVDSCGNLIGPANAQKATVLASFSNLDATISLVHIGNGIWSGTWKPVNPATAPVTVSVTAFNSGSSSPQSGQAPPLSATVLPGAAPIVTAAGVQNTATQLSGLPVAPGMQIALNGANFGDGTQAFLGSESLNVLFAGPALLVVQVPLDVPTNSQLQLTAQNNGLQSLPEQLVVAAAQPGIFTADGSGTGQGVIYKSDGMTVAQPGTPATAGEVVTLQCTGIGVPGTPLSVTIAGLDAQASSGVATDNPGVYLVTATVPPGLAGNAIPVILTAAGQPSPPVTIAIQ